MDAINLSWACCGDVIASLRHCYVWSDTSPSGPWAGAFSTTSWFRDGQVIMVETKTGNAELTDNQEAIIAALEEGAAVPVGQNAAMISTAPPEANCLRSIRIWGS
jgi:hypothetical protein